ncbi:M50 family metallopeptidase [Pseudofulvimonas gallinarii]|uniref:Peptidase M50B-like protein n=1 Tax=Pseudofulvimonas gallinarii TaxID=634155 RepID=A0A4V2UVY4_9GAMM|nr:M50 family metallopeptidase [Pseudofulvimonas gallinarii]TCS97527.1 peptidase M50B-like protein [Pseudofulvimonas gallinarii]
MTRRNALSALATATGLSLVVLVLPLVFPSLSWIAWPLQVLATLFHELGHGLAAILCGGEFVRLDVYADGSGVASTMSSGSRLSRAIIAAGGPLAPPFAALALFLSARQPASARRALLILAGLLLLCLALWLRTPVGILLALAVVAALALLLARGSPLAIQSGTCFLAIELSLAAFASVDYLFTAEASTAAGRMPSDTGQIAHALFLPHWFWGGLIAALSLAVLWFGLSRFARALRAA